jgi:hypothetical protein
MGTGEWPPSVPELEAPPAAAVAFPVSVSTTEPLGAVRAGGLQFGFCGRCGAAVLVLGMTDEGSADNRADHTEWHRLQDELLVLLADSVSKSLRARLHSLLRKAWRQ